MTLRERRVLFTKLLADLILWCFDRGWQVALDEGTVKSPRRVRGVDSGELIFAYDAVHKRAGKHPSGEACDLLLYDDLDGDGQDDDYVADGSDPRWLEIAERWEAMHPLCTSGIRWRDANHVSIAEGDRSTPLADIVKGDI